MLRRLGGVASALGLSLFRLRLVFLFRLVLLGLRLVRGTRLRGFGSGLAGGRSGRIRSLCLRLSGGALSVRVRSQERQNDTERRNPAPLMARVRSENVS